MSLLLLALVATVARANPPPVPPSSMLTGPNGTLSWGISASGDTLVIDGRSPKWTVHHVSRADLTPVRTERRAAAGNAVTVDYTAAGAVVHAAGKDTALTGTDLWDGDTVDVRLGRSAASGHPDVSFHAVDPASATIYGFEATGEGTEVCAAATACTHVHLVMTGVYRLVGPSWDYWYGADGQLLRFQGPIGAFTAVSR